METFLQKKRLGNKNCLTPPLLANKGPQIILTNQGRACGKRSKFKFIAWTLSRKKADQWKSTTLQNNLEFAFHSRTDKMVQTSENCPSRRRSSSARRSQKVNGDKNSNMKVVVRVRPANNMEIGKQSSTSVRVMDERMLVFDPKDDSVDYLSGDRRRKQPQFLKRRARDLRFMFDRVFDHESSNRDVFEHTTKTIVEGVLGGYNCTVFAYGATGAGKTFTMLGDQSNPGVMFLTMMELYSRINACKDEKISDVAVSYLEVRSW